MGVSNGLDGVGVPPDLEGHQTGFCVAVRACSECHCRQAVGSRVCRVPSPPPPLKIRPQPIDPAMQRFDVPLRLQDVVEQTDRERDDEQGDISNQVH